MGGLGSKHQLGPEVFLLLAIFLPNFDLENMILIYMKQCFYWGKFLAKF
jgi:hypothetical protein